MPLPTADHGMAKNGMQNVFEMDGTIQTLPQHSSWGLREDRMYGMHMEPAMYSRIMSLKELNLESERINLQEKIAARLFVLNGLDANFINNEPHVYAEEGELDKVHSLDDISIADNSQGLDFLQDLGSKSSTLGGVCQEGLTQKGFRLKSATNGY